MDKLVVGQIIKAFGIRGEVKIKPLTDDVYRFEKLRTVYVSDAQYKITACRINDGFVYLKFLGVNDRNTSESLVGNNLLIDRADAVDLPEGRYFISDVIGLDLYLDSGKKIGVIEDIVSGNVDYYYIDTVEGKAVFPLVKDLLVEIDVENKKVTVKAKRFTEVVMYEN